MINQYPTQKYVPSKRNFYLSILIGLVLIALVLIAIFVIISPHKVVCGDNICDSTETKQNCCKDCGCPKGYQCQNNKCLAKCGNGLCESDENCYDCPKDCKCGTDEYCSDEKKRCVMIQCGNDICEPFESPENCCLDCKCTIPGEVCNSNTKKCEMQEVNISDERINELVIQYFRGNGKEVVSTENLGTFIWENKIGKRIRAEIKDEWIYTVLVTKDEEVIELPTM